MMMYRNKEDIESKEGILVDQGSLWRLDMQERLMVLVDEDQYVTAAANEELFEKEK